ncbi:MAG: hypothetical protein SPL13_04440 [Clostridia bacterium]|nr:hypothetical protein [Clostridia bacterium]
MKPEKNDKIINMLAFFTIAIIAILIVIMYFFPVIGIEVKGAFLSVLQTLQNVLILIVVGLAGFEFVRNRKKGWKIAYWIFIAIFVVATVFIWIQ